MPWLLAKAVADSVYAAATGLPPVNPVPPLKGYVGQGPAGANTPEAGPAAMAAGAAAALPAPAPAPLQQQAARRCSGAVLPAVLALQEALGREGEEDDDLPVGAPACEVVPAAAKRCRVATGGEAAGFLVPADLGQRQQLEQPACAAAAPPACAPASSGGKALAQGIVKVEKALAGEMGAPQCREAAEAPEKAPAAAAAGGSEQEWEQVDSDIEMLLCS